jgi:hypothetical protein
MADENTNTTDKTSSPVGEEVTEQPPEGQQDEPLGETGMRALEAERKARRSAERQLEALGSRVENLQRAEAERHAADVLSDPTDLWRDAELADVLDENGDVQAGAVQAVADTVASNHPHWRKRTAPAGSADARKGTEAEPNADDIAARLIRGR